MLSLFLAATIGATDASSPLLRANNKYSAATTDSSLDIPTLAESRQRRRTEEETESTVTGTVSISTSCLNNLAAAADENGQIGKENYFV